MAFSRRTGVARSSSRKCPRRLTRTSTSCSRRCSWLPTRSSSSSPTRARTRRARSSRAAWTSVAARRQRCSCSAARCGSATRSSPGRLGQGSRAVRLPRRAGQGGAAGYAGRDPWFRQAAAGGRARPGGGERAPGATSGRPADPAPAGRGACEAGEAGPSLEDLFTRLGEGGPGSERDRQGRRAGIRGGSGRRAQEDPAPGGTDNVIHTGIGAIPRAT